MMNCHDSTFARLIGEIRKLRKSGSLGFEADEAQARFPTATRGAADSHAETLMSKPLVIEVMEHLLA
jgi:hypothetical protein